MSKLHSFISYYSQSRFKIFSTIIQVILESSIPKILKTKKKMNQNYSIHQSKHIRLYKLINRKKKPFPIFYVKYSQDQLKLSERLMGLNSHLGILPTEWSSNNCIQVICLMEEFMLLN